MATSIDIAEDLTCPICLSIFNKPNILPCLHTFCATCINDVINTKQEDEEFPCPVCKAITEIPERGSEGLKDNFLASSLAEKYNSSREKNSFCSKHSSQELNLFCVDCKELLCSTCMLSGHKKHNLTSPGEAFKIIEEDIQTRTRFVAKKLSTGKVRIQEMQNAKTSFEEDLKSTSAAISEHFDTICERAKATEKQLLARVRHEGEATVELLNAELQIASSSLESAQKSYETATQFLDAKHDAKKLRDHSKVKDQLIDKEWLEIAPRISVPRLITEYEDATGFKVNVHMRSSIEGHGQIIPNLLAEAELVRHFKAFDGNEMANLGEGGITFLNDLYVITNMKKGVGCMFWWDGEMKQQTIKLSSPLDVTSSKDGQIYIVERQIKGILVFDKFLALKKVLKNVYSGDEARIACDNNIVVVVSKREVIVLDRDGIQLTRSKFQPYHSDAYMHGCSKNSLQGHVAISDSGQIFCTYGCDMIPIKKDGGTIMYAHGSDTKLKGFSRAMCCDQWGHVIIVLEGNNPRLGKNMLIVKSEYDQSIEEIRFESGTMETGDVCSLTVSGPGEVSILTRRGDVKVYKYLDL